jgi:DNA polymerase IV
MPLALNHNPPTIMHVDLNSCFATIEQQANPLLRGKPIVVAAYNSPNGCVVAPSIEAKRYGIKTGMTVREARLLYPPVVVRTPDPPKYGCV